MSGPDKCPKCTNYTMPRWDSIATARACQTPDCKEIEIRTKAEKRSDSPTPLTTEPPHLPQ